MYNVDNNVYEVRAREPKAVDWNVKKKLIRSGLNTHKIACISEFEIEKKGEREIMGVSSFRHGLRCYRPANIPSA